MASPLDLLLIAALAWCGVGVLGLVGARSIRYVAHFLFPLGAAIGLVVAGAALVALGGGRRAARVAGRLAGSADASAPGCLERVLSVRARGRGGRDLDLRGRLFSRRRGHGAGAHVPPVPRLSRQHGLRAAGRRRLRVHGGVGDDGAVVVLSRHDAASPGGDQARRIPLPVDRARRRARHPARLRGACRVAGGSSPSTRCAPRSFAGMGERRRSRWRCSASAPRPGSCRCTCGCRKRIRRRRRRCRR